MIRFHYKLGSRETQYLVTARRKPRGYVIKASVGKYVTTLMKGLGYDAKITETYVVTDGWAPMGFNGVVGKVYLTRKEAAQALVGDHKFDEAK